MYFTCLCVDDELLDESSDDQSDLEILNRIKALPPPDNEGTYTQDMYCTLRFISACAYLDGPMARLYTLNSKYVFISARPRPV